MEDQCVVSEFLREGLGNVHDFFTGIVNLGSIEALIFLSIILNTENLGASEQEHQKNGHLIDGLSDDVSEHNRRHNAIISWVGFLLKKLLTGGLGC